MVWKNEQVSEKETIEILRCAWSVLRFGVPGDFVEMGCYRGDTAIFLTEVLLVYEKMCRGEIGSDSGGMRGNGGVVYASDLKLEQGRNGGKPVENSVGKYEEKLVQKDDLAVENPVKKLWIYDSFEGLPEKSAMDESALGVDFKRGELAVTKREVKERFLRAGLKVPVIKKGWFQDLTEADLPGQISLAFLDGDFYESIRDSLRLVENLMADGGKLLIHDYNNPALPGVAKAVDEWCAGRNLKKRVEGSMMIIEVYA